MVNDVQYQLRLKNEEYFYGNILNTSHLLGHIATVIAAHENRRAMFITGTPDGRGVVVSVERGPLNSQTIRALEDCLVIKKVRSKKAR